MTRLFGRSSGGYGTKTCTITDAIGRATAFIVAPGQTQKLPHAMALLDRLPDVPKGADALRDVVRDYAMETLAGPDAVVIGEMGFLEQGEVNCGVGRSCIPSPSSIIRARDTLSATGSNGPSN